MVIAGEWFLCSDDIVRPLIRGEALAFDGSWIQVPFLVDSGADRTVFSGALLAKLGLTPLAVQEGISGLGGAADSVVVETQIQFARETGGQVVFRGSYAAVTGIDTLDISVLGRDVMDLFAVIVDRPGDVVSLVGQRHRYTIEQI